MDQEIVKKVKGCDKCQANQSAPAEAPLHPWEWPGLPRSRIHVDYAGPYKGEMFLVVVNAYSKWLEVHRMKSITSTATIEKLREMFATHGLPATLVSNNGSRENDVAEEPVVSVTPSVTPGVTPVVLPDPDATSLTPGVSDQLEAPKSPSVALTQTPVKTSSLVTRPVRKRVRPAGYLKDYLCE